MKYLLLLLVSINSFAATPGAVPSVTVSAPGANTGSVSISPSQLSGSSGTNHIFSLFCYANASATNQYFPCYYNGAVYKVGNATSGGTPSAYCFDITAGSTTPSSSFQLMSATATFANNATSVTGGQWMGGVTGSYPLTTGSVSQVAAVVPGVYTFSNATYVGMQLGPNVIAFLHMDCFEQ